MTASPSCLVAVSAEELSSGQVTTRAGDDIEKATDLARRMVYKWE